MDHSKPSQNGRKKYRGQGNVSSLPNDQIFCDWWCRHCGQCIGPLLQAAGFYLNPEANGGAGEDGVTGATVDLTSAQKAMAFLVKSALLAAA